MRIGSHTLQNELILAPMAGVTDRPFRQLCRKFGAGLAVSEMVSSNSALWDSAKTQRRLDFCGEPGPVSVQILGADPGLMAAAARANVERGADIIDINMGCPAKKVLKSDAGAALMRNEALAARIMRAVVDAVEVPVTLKMRTGWDVDNKNAPALARIAEESGIQAIAIHGRTRSCGYSGVAEFDTIRRIKHEIGIPVIANGDIDSPAKALQVLNESGADGLMIGRAAQGKPWIFGEIEHYLRHGRTLRRKRGQEILNILLGHLDSLYRFYGEHLGVRVARKHIAWYSRGLRDGAAFRKTINNSNSATEQLDLVQRYFAECEEIAA